MSVIHQVISLSMALYLRLSAGGVSVEERLDQWLKEV